MAPYWMIRMVVAEAEGFGCDRAAEAVYLGD